MRCLLGHVLSKTAHIVGSYCGIARNLRIHGKFNTAFRYLQGQTIVHFFPWGINKPVHFRLILPLGFRALHKFHRLMSNFWYKPVLVHFIFARKSTHKMLFVNAVK